MNTLQHEGEVGEVWTVTLDLPNNFEESLKTFVRSQYLQRKLAVCF
jgi:hypothetical protein